MLIMSIYNDPDINPFIYDDESLRMRRLLSTEDSHSFNVFSYASCHLPIDRQFGAYYTKIGEEPRVEIQGLFVLAAASTFDPPASASDGDWMTIGTLTLHYQVELFEPNLFMSSDTVDRFEWALAGTETVDEMFVNFASDENVFALLASTLETALGYVLHRYHLIVCYPYSTWTVNSLPVTIYTPDSTDNGTTLFARGGLWYLRMNKDSTLMLDIHQSLSLALDDTPECRLESTLNAAHLVTGACVLFIYDTRVA
jgi:hypothetical protein